MEKEKILTSLSTVARARNKWVRTQGRKVFGGRLKVMLQFKFLLGKSPSYRLAKAGRGRWRNDHSPLFSYCSVPNKWVILFFLDFHSPPRWLFLTLVSRSQSRLGRTFWQLESSTVWRGVGSRVLKVPFFNFVFLNFLVFLQHLLLKVSDFKQPACSVRPGINYL